MNLVDSLELTDKTNKQLFDEFKNATLKIQYTREILDFGELGLWVLGFWECWGFGDVKDPFLN